MRDGERSNKHKHVFYGLCLALLLWHCDALGQSLPGQPMAPDARAEELFRSLKDTTASGVVLDEASKPIEGARILIYWEELTAPRGPEIARYSWIESDRDGAWRFPLRKSVRAFIQEVQKEGYRYPVTMTVIKELKDWTADDLKPSVIRLNRQGKRFFLLKRRGELLRGISPQPVVVNCDLVFEKCSPVLDDGFRADVRIEAHYTPGSDWVVSYHPGFPGGGILESTEVLMEAPKSGYLGSVVATGSRDMHLYVRSRTPAILMRVDINQDTRSVGDLARSIRINFEALINPYGLPGLEYEPRLTSDYKVEERLEREALSSLKAQRLPSVPDLEAQLRK